MVMTLMMTMIIDPTLFYCLLKYQGVNCIKYLHTHFFPSCPVAQLSMLPPKACLPLAHQTLSCTHLRPLLLQQFPFLSFIFFSISIKIYCFTFIFKRKKVFLDSILSSYSPFLFLFIVEVLRKEFSVLTVFIYFISFSIEFTQFRNHFPISTRRTFAQVTSEFYFI